MELYRNVLSPRQPISEGVNPFPIADYFPKDEVDCMVGAHDLTETLSITVVNTGGTPRSMVTQGDAVIRA